MSEFLTEKAKQLKKEGYDFSSIRTFLENSNLKENEIKLIFQKIENSEFHELIYKQKLSRVKNELIGSIILFGISLTYNIYRYGADKGIDIITFAIPISIFLVFYDKYLRIKNKKFTISSIMRESRRNRWHK